MAFWWFITEVLVLAGLFVTFYRDHRLPGIALLALAVLTGVVAVDVTNSTY